MSHSEFNSLRTLKTANAQSLKYYSLQSLEKENIGLVSRLPVSLRIVLESVLRNLDGKRIRPEDVVSLAKWQPKAPRVQEIPFVVARILLQDFTGVPLLVDLAAMRSAVQRLGRSPSLIEPLVPVDLVIDHSVQVDYSRSPDSLEKNMNMEFKRNMSRYQFLKWGMSTFETFKVVPPGIGICHQVNLESLAQAVVVRDGLAFPDTLVGTDSHTTMINGLGIVGWGVGGIEAEAGMLGQPIYFLTPDVVGVQLKGALQAGVTATDLVLHVTQVLRKANVVGKFVEYFGEGAASLSVPDRATLANMAPEYGATMGFFPFDEKSVAYLLETGRSPEHVDLVRRYFQEQGLFGVPRAGECDYTSLIEVDLSQVEASVSGPKRPQDRISLKNLKQIFDELLQKPVKDSGYGKSAHELQQKFATTMQSLVKRRNKTVAGGGEQKTDTVQAGVGDVSSKNTSSWTEWEMVNNRPTPDRVEISNTESFSDDYIELSHGDILIAAITSCTNTSNPSVMLAAGLLAKKAVEKGMTVPAHVKTSLAPGSRVVTEYLRKTGLQSYLDELGFHTVGYGCTTCIGNSGPLDSRLENVIKQHDVIAASVLSGNRNFEARIHQSVKANFLMSPPLVVAFALAGTINIDLLQEPLHYDDKGKPVYLREIWPTQAEILSVLDAALDPETYKRLYRDYAELSPMWQAIASPTGEVYAWDEESTYIQEPPFFDKFGMQPNGVADIRKARPLAIYGDSVTTDHISPAGSITPDSPAGIYLKQKNVDEADFNTYGARRGNDRIMTRGTFANVRIRNLMVPGSEGGVTLYQPVGEKMSLYDASMLYQGAGVHLIVFAGKEYGTGSSRDWAAKGTRLLGVKAVIAESYERIHRSNLVGMGVLPCQFVEGMSAKTLALDGTEVFDLTGISESLVPRQELNLHIQRQDGRSETVTLIARLDTPIEVDYYRHGGILPYVLRQILKKDGS